MAKSIFKFLESVKESSFYGGGGAIKPVEPFPNSIAAKQMEQQELAEEAANNPQNQLMQTQKAQQDAVNQLQQAQQQIQQLQGELQNAQMTAQQQAQQAQMQAQQEAQQAKMDAQYELQAEKIKNQKALLSMQEKYMKGMQKQPKDQGGILANQLKRVVSRVSKLAAEKKAAVNRIPSKQEWAAMTPQQRQEISGGAKPLLSNIPDFASNLGQNVVDYWKDPKGYIGSTNAASVINPETGESSFFNLTGALGGNKPFNENLSQGNYLNAAGNLLGGTVDMFGNMAMSGGVNTASGLNNIARGNLGRGAFDLGLGALDSVASIAPIQGVGKKLLGSTARRFTPMTLNVNKAVTPTLQKFKPIPSALDKIKKIGDLGFKGTMGALTGSQFLDRINKPIKSGSDNAQPDQSKGHYGSNMTPQQTIDFVDSNIDEALEPNPPPMVGADTLDGAAKAVKNIYDKALSPMAPAPIPETLSIMPLHRTNIQYLQNKNPTNNYWAYPMLGNEKRPYFGPLGDLVGDVLGTVSPSLRIGRQPDAGVLGKSLSYEPKYKLNTSEL